MTREETMFCLTRLVAIVLAAALGPVFAQAEAVAEFYKGKTVRVIIGTGVGGTYGVYGQLVARHFGRFIPGNPAVVMQSMQGAGGFTALNWLGTAAPRDGTVITIGQINIVHEGLFNTEAKFDPRGFLWLGRFTSFASIGVASKKSGIRSLADVKAREVAAGAPGAQSVPGQAPVILNRIAGTKFKVVAGYRSTGESFLALERGEVDVAATSMDALRSLHWPKLESGDLVPIFVQGVRQLKEFPDAPTLGEFGNNEVERAFLGVFNVTAEVGRSLATPPGLPADRLAALRTAYQAMVADPAFLADIEKLGIVLDLLPGAALQEVIGASMKMSPETQEQARKFYEDLFKGH
jgi:tripartite-type tricarboxylate transporter receptor subunit TctC